MEIRRPSQSPQWGVYRIVCIALDAMRAQTHLRSRELGCDLVDVSKWLRIAARASRSERSGKTWR